jgi:polysaccharide export outer membrane protein
MLIVWLARLVAVRDDFGGRRDMRVVAGEGSAMGQRRFIQARHWGALWALVLAVAGGCHTTRPAHHAGHADLPRELAKVAMPPYVIEPPDILLIDAVRLVPPPTYKIEPLDSLSVQLANALPTDPVDGVYTVELNGTIDLGQAYGGPIGVLDMTIDEARAAIAQRFAKAVNNPNAKVNLVQSRALQQIAGTHLVGPDGTVNLGVYGPVYVAGHTLPAAKAAIEEHLSKVLFRPEVSVDVYAYNSKVYYIITDGGGLGEQVVRVPLTGNETVLDAVSQINGLPAVASKKGVWVARPTPSGQSKCDILPVDWKGIARSGRTDTNYQVMAGDRIYVMAQPLVTADTALGRFISPIERVFGVILLSNTSIRSFDRNAGNTGVVVPGVFVP